MKQLDADVVSNLSSKYKVKKYLGHDDHGFLYLVVDGKNNRYIWKKIQITDTDTDIDVNVNNSLKYKQLSFELSLLNYLSNNTTTKEYINPCLEYSVVNNTVFTLFPVFNGYSLSYYKNYLLKLEYVDYYRLILYLIKSILHGMAKIHKTHIAHQKLDETCILISRMNDKDLHVKFTDFGLGCGNVDALEHNDYKQLIGTCETNNNIPLVITSNIKQLLSKSGYLQLSQKYDLLCLGMIFIKLLLFFDNLDIDMKAGYTHKFIKNTKQHLIQLINNPNRFKLDIPTRLKNDILEYIRLFLKFIFCKTHLRQNCQYVLDKIIIYEKYKNE